MAKRAAASIQATDQLSQEAGKHLAALRGELERRLSTLEEVLSDPSRGESLAGLILDLSRVATEEAQAAAAHACLVTRTEAEKENGELRSAAQAANAALEAERASAAELRQDVDLARQELRAQTELLAAQGQLERDLQAALDAVEAERARGKLAAAELQRAAAEVARELEAERRSSADAQAQLQAQRKGAEDAETQLQAQRRSVEDAQTQLQAQRKSAEDAQAHLQAERAIAEDAQAQLKAERKIAADAQSQLQAERTKAEDAEAQLKAERKIAGELREETVRAAERVLALEREQTDARAAYDRSYAEMRAAHEALAQELERAKANGSGRDRVDAELQSQLEALRAQLETERAQAANQRRDAGALSDPASAEALSQAQADLERERVANADLRRAADNIDQQLASSRSNEVQMLANVDRLALQIEGLKVERDKAVGELVAAQQWIKDLQAAEAEFTLPATASSPSAAPAAKAAAAPPPPPTPKAPEPAAKTEEEWQAVRLASRYVFSKGVAVQVNGDPGTLFDISASGCQLLCPSALKPNQVIKVLLPSEPPLVTCTGKVVWTRLEPAARGKLLSYRAGVKFTKSDDVAIEKFAIKHGASVIADSEQTSA